jgi:hypothetical protein
MEGFWFITFRRAKIRCCENQTNDNHQHITSGANQYVHFPLFLVNSNRNMKSTEIFKPINLYHVTTKEGKLSEPQSQSHSHTATDSQSVSMSWCQAQIWDIWPEIFFFKVKVTVLYFWGALSDERSGLSCISLCHWSLHSLVYLQQHLH